MHYLKFLESIHTILKPSVYFEVGLRQGASLRLANKTVIGVDPSHSIQHEISKDSHIFTETSDDFFASDRMKSTLNGRKVDFAFIDGWHNFEFALRDFLNTEAFCRRDSVVVFDDVLPRNESEAVRKPHGGAWTGDVWKVGACLAKYRPDLRLIFAKTIPTGLLVVTNLDPESRRLKDLYPALETEYLASTQPLLPPKEYTDRFISPGEALVQISARR